MPEQEFVKVAEVGEIGPGQMTMVRLGRSQVLLANVGGTFYAINNICTHCLVIFVRIVLSPPAPGPGWPWPCLCFVYDNVMNVRIFVFLLLW